MQTELVSIPTDTVPLDGAFYLPDGGAPRGGVLLMHGNTMNFYVGAPRFLPPYLTAEGFACLAFNRRGHDILGIRDSRSGEGGAFQTFAQGRADNDYAAAFLAERGFPEPVVMGHSMGGLLAAQFAGEHPETRALVLLSAITGGRHRAERDTNSGYLAGDRTADIMVQAEELVAQGRGQELLLLPGWWYVISAESFLDRFRHRPSLAEAAATIRCPVLFLRGDQEGRAGQAAEELAGALEAPLETATIDACDHFYVGREAAVGGAVMDWLRRSL